jgi:hypothetical protein
LGHQEEIPRVPHFEFALTWPCCSPVAIAGRRDEEHFPRENPLTKPVIVEHSQQHCYTGTSILKRPICYVKKEVKPMNHEYSSAYSKAWGVEQLSKYFSEASGTKLSKVHGWCVCVRFQPLFCSKSGTKAHGWCVYVRFQPLFCSRIVWTA